MSDSADRKVAIFTEALRVSPEQRTALFIPGLGGDLELRSQVDALLRAHDEAGDFRNQWPVLVEL